MQDARNQLEDEDFVLLTSANESRFELCRSRSRYILKARLLGFWTEADARRYASEIETAISNVRATGRPIKVIVDRTEFLVQTAEVLGTIQNAVRRNLQSGDRLAIVCPSALIKRQVDRLPLPPEGRVFATMADGWAWLTETV